MSKNYSVLFVHDLKFDFDQEGKIFCTEGLSELYFDRFLCSGYSSVKIISRYRKSFEKLSIFYKSSVKLSSASLQAYVFLLMPIFYYRAIIDIFKSNLIVISTPSILGSIVGLLCILLNRPYVVEVAGDCDSFSSKRGGFVVSFILSYYMPLLVNKAIGASYVSSYLSNKFPCKGNTIISSNVNILKIQSKYIDSNSLKIADEINIGFVGGLTRRKGVDLLIEAANILVYNYKHKNLIFHLVGGSPDINIEMQLSRLNLKNNFLIHGSVNYSEVCKFMGIFDIYVQPSISEGLPRATLEAMSFGLPVVATKLPGFYEILPDDCLVGTGDGIDLADKINNFIIDRKFYDRHSNNNLNTAKAFLYEVLHKKRCDFYGSFLNKWFQGRSASFK